MSLLLLVHPPLILRVFSNTTHEGSIAGHFSKGQSLRARRVDSTRSSRAGVDGGCADLREVVVHHDLSISGRQRRVACANFWRHSPSMRYACGFNVRDGSVTERELSRESAMTTKKVEASAHGSAEPVKATEQKLKEAVDNAKRLKAKSREAKLKLKQAKKAAKR